MTLDSIMHWYLLIGAVLAVLQVAITWPIHPKAPAFFYTLGVACMVVLWPLFLLSMLEAYVDDAKAAAMQAKFVAEHLDNYEPDAVE